MDAPLPPVIVIGVDHRTCPDAVRERLFVDDGEMSQMLSALKTAGALEAMVLSTCNRVEVIARFGEDADPRRGVAGALGQPVDLAGDVLEPLLYVHEGSDAVRHVFRVASSLDSQVVGEPQVLGQVRAAHRLCRDLGATGSAVDALLRASYETAKRVRSDTSIGEGPVSLAAAAIARIRDLYGDLKGRRGVIAGTADLGLLVAEHLAGNGMQDLQVIDRFPRRAAAAAREIGAHHGGLDELARALDTCDVLVTSIGEGRYVVSSEMVEAALKRRRRRPIFLLDLSIPGDVEPAVHRLDEAFVYDFGDLEQIARSGMNDRAIEAAKAERIVEDAVADYARTRSGRDAGADIARLRSHIESEIAAVIDDPDLARRLSGRLTHAPSATLRELAEAGQLDDATRDLVARLFGVDDPKEGEQP